MLIREYTADDCDSVLQLWESQGIRLEGGERAEMLARKQECDQDLFLVAENKGVILGVVVGSWDGWKRWISHLAVDRASKGMGYRVALVREAERRLKEKGAREVVVLVPRENLEAQDFFQHMGFEVDERELLLTKRL